jgi:hypothetical protein
MAMEFQFQITRQSRPQLPPERTRGPAWIRSALQRVYGLGSIGPWFIEICFVSIYLVLLFPF